MDCRNIQLTENVQRLRNNGRNRTGKIEYIRKNDFNCEGDTPAGEGGNGTDRDKDGTIPLGWRPNHVWTF